MSEETTNKRKIIAPVSAYGEAVANGYTGTKQEFGTYLANAAEKAEETVENALVAEGYATGKQNGVPVGSGSQYYENNAEYFSQQAAAKLAEVNTAGETKIAAIEAKGEETLESIPDDYSELSDEVSLNSYLVNGLDGYENYIFINVTPTETLTGKYIDENGNLQNAGSIDVQKFAVSPGEIYEVWAVTSPKTNSVYAITNSSGTVVDHYVSSTGQTCHKYRVTIPSDGAYLYVSKADYASFYAMNRKISISTTDRKQQLSSVPAGIEDILTNPTFESVSLSLIAGSYIINSGRVYTLSGSSYCLLNARPGDFYSISGTDYFDAQLCIAKKDDATYQTIYGRGGSTNVTDFLFRVPDNTYCLFINSRDDNPTTIKKVVSFSGDAQQVAENTAALAEIEPKLSVITTKPGKNLCNGVTESGYFSSMTTWVSSSSWVTFDYIPVDAETSYTYSFATPSDIREVGTPYFFVFYDASKTAIGFEQNYPTVFNKYFTTPANCAFVRFATNTLPVRKPQVEKGQVNTNYVAYELINVFNGETANSKPKWDGLLWVCVGDSLTEENDATTKHYHDYIAEKTGISVNNMGISGTGYANGAGGSNAFYQRIANVPTDADVVTIFGSFNDLSTGLSIGTITDSGTTTICGCINETIDNLFSAFPLANIGIVAPTPWYDLYPGATSPSGDNYVTALKQICERRGIPFLDLYHSSNLRPWDSAFRELAYTKDSSGGVHPDETGHAIIAPRFMAFLDSLLLH